MHSASEPSQELSFQEKIKKAKMMVTLVRRTLPREIKGSTKDISHENFRNSIIWAAIFLGSLSLLRDRSHFYAHKSYQYMAASFAAPGLIEQTIKDTYELIKKEKHHFAQEEKATVVLDSQNPNRPLKILFENGRVDVHLGLDYSYSPQVFEYMISADGKFAGLDVVEHGAENVTEKVCRQFRAFYYIDPNNSPNIDALYNGMNLQELALENDEMRILTKIFRGVTDHFNPQRTYLEKINHEMHWIEVTKQCDLHNMDDLFAKKMGVCLEQTFCLAYLFDKAKKQNLLNGKYQIEIRGLLEKKGHMWLSYSLPGKSEQLIVDPRNNFLKYYSEANDVEKASYSLMYKLEPELSLRSLLGSPPSESKESMPAQTSETVSPAPAGIPNQIATNKRYLKYGTMLGLGLVGIGACLFGQKYLSARLSVSSEMNRGRVLSPDPDFAKSATSRLHPNA